MKIYIAGWLGSQERLQLEKAKLEALGHTITSSWLQEKVTDPTKLTPQDLLLDSNQLLAAKDFWEIDESELLILDTVDVSDRGGREVELGYAIGRKIPRIVIGPKRNVFHYLVREHYETWEEFFNKGDCWLWE